LGDVQNSLVAEKWGGEFGWLNPNCGGKFMLNFFKRSVAPKSSIGEPATACGSNSVPRRFADLAMPPLALPEVIEGNGDSDCSLWADSVAFQDSQLPHVPIDCVIVSGLGSADRAPLPGANDTLSDVFASVQRHSG